MVPSQEALAFAERHVIDCEQHVARQRQLLEHLGVVGTAHADAATSLLQQFEANCALVRVHRDWLRWAAQRPWPWQQPCGHEPHR